MIILTHTEYIGVGFKWYFTQTDMIIAHLILNISFMSVARKPFKSESTHHPGLQAQSFTFWQKLPIWQIVVFYFGSTSLISVTLFLVNPLILWILVAESIVTHPCHLSVVLGLSQTQSCQLLDPFFFFWETVPKSNNVWFTLYTITCYLYINYVTACSLSLGNLS